MPKAKYTTQKFKEAMAEINPNIEVLGEYINCKEKIRCKCLVCNNLYYPTPEHLLRGQSCKCMRGAKIGKALRKKNDQFVSEVNRVNPDIEILGTYKGSHERILVRCKVCNNLWSPTAGSLSSGFGCKQCAMASLTSNKPLSNAEFVKRVAEINPNINVVGQYEGAAKHVRVRCKLCGKEWDTLPSTIYNGGKCWCINRHNLIKRLSYTHDEFVQALHSVYNGPRNPDHIFQNHREHGMIKKTQRRDKP